MYKWIETGRTVRLLPDDATTIPCVPGNGDYAEFVEWQAQGNTPEPEDRPTQSDLIKQEIVALENANPITHRAQRELA